jgi:hypothetical protein
MRPPTRTGSSAGVNVDTVLADYQQSLPGEGKSHSRSNQSTESDRPRSVGWSDQFLEMDLPELDLKEGAQALRSTDRGTPAPSHLIRDRFTTTYHLYLNTGSYRTPGICHRPSAETSQSRNDPEQRWNYFGPNRKGGHRFYG